MCSGRLFQMRGPATENARVPSVNCEIVKKMPCHLSLPSVILARRTGNFSLVNKDLYITKLVGATTHL